MMMLRGDAAVPLNLSPMYTSYSSMSCGTFCLAMCLIQKKCLEYVCMVITYNRVWTNRVRLPILLEVS